MQADTAVTRVVRGDGVYLRVYEWGGASGQAVSTPRPTILLVHGYPDNARVWQRLAPLLAERYHVVAYDVRGAGHSGRPRQTSAYRLEHLARDMAAVIDATCADAAVHLVGHDWGSIQSWEAVATQPLASRIASFTAISGPSLDHLGHWLGRCLRGASEGGRRQAARQLRHSWYVFAFHLPLAFPLAWKLGLARAWPALLKRQERVELAADHSQAADGAAGVKLYRANVLPRLLKPRQRRVELPVQLIVPLHDRFVLPEAWSDLWRWVPRLWRREIVAGHWVQLSDPRQLAAWIEEFAAFVDGGAETAALQAAHEQAHTQAGDMKADGVSAPPSHRCQSRPVATAAEASTRRA